MFPISLIIIDFNEIAFKQIVFKVVRAAKSEHKLKWEFKETTEITIQTYFY